MSDEGHVRHELGAYLLGALEPGERRAVEAHVDTCPGCRDELAQLSGLPSLLDRISVEEATADLPHLGARLAAATHEVALREHAGLRRHVARWRAAAVAATLAAVAATVVAWEPWAPPPPPGVVVRVVPAADVAAAVEGTVEAHAWEWGTTIELHLDDLPPRSAYVVWAIAEDGRRERAGTWGPTADGGATVRGASAILRPDLAAVEVTAPDGTVLLTAAFDGLAA